MGLLFADGFTTYGSVSDLQNGKTYSAYNPTIAYQTSGGPVNNSGIVEIGPYADLRWTDANRTNIAFGIGFSFWFRIPQSISQSLSIFQTVHQGPLSTTPSGHFGISLYASLTTGILSLYRFYDSTVLGSTPASTLVVGQWHHIEVFYEIADGTGGSARLWVDGVQHINQTGIDTFYTTYSSYSAWAPLSGFRFGSQNYIPTDNLEYSHVIFWDDVDDGRTGDMTSYGYGPMFVEEIRPTGSGTYSQWTNSGGGSNYQDVDETTVSSTDYLTGTTDATLDTYTFPDPSSNVNTILGVGVGPKVHRTAFQPRYLQSLCISSGSTAEDRILSVPRSTGELRRNAMGFFTVDPLTTSAWSTSGIGTAEFGMGLKTSTST